MTSQKIKRLRIKKKLTQETLAYLSGISHNTIVKIENDATENPTVKTLSHIARA
jgi:transcriptional regulator with XRE-family HTH domain